MVIMLALQVSCFRDRHRFTKAPYTKYVELNNIAEDNINLNAKPSKYKIHQVGNPISYAARGDSLRFPSVQTLDNSLIGPQHRLGL